MWGSAIAGIAGAGASIYQTDKNIEYQQQANEQNIQLQKDINQQNIDNQWKMWNATNEYNSPAAQMARYREAGLNPHLIYGQSNTAQAMNVGTAQAPQVQAKHMNLNLDSMFSWAGQYLDLLSKKQDLEQKKIETDIMGSTYDDVLQQTHLKTQHLERMLTKVDKEIESIGFENTYKSYQNQIKSFEVDMLPILRSLKENELSISNSQVDLIPTVKLKANAEYRLTEFTIGLTEMKQKLVEAQKNSEVEKLGLTKAQVSYYLQQVNESLERVNKIKSDVTLNTAYFNYYKKGFGISQFKAVNDIYHSMNAADLLNFGRGFSDLRDGLYRDFIKLKK